MTTKQNSRPVKTYIGIDCGDERIGVARINTVAQIGEPLTVLEAKNASLLDTLQKLVAEHSADGLVVGIARGLDGQETQQTNKTREFAVMLARELSVPIYQIDEALSSQEAQTRIDQGNKGSIDSVAASVILEDFVRQPNQEEYEVIG